MIEEQPMPATTNVPDTGRQAAHTSPLEAGRSRVVIEGVTPEIDGGRFPGGVLRLLGSVFAARADRERQNES